MTMHFRSSVFDYDKENNLLVADASDLFLSNRWGLPSAIDITSERTGRTVRFVFSKREYDAGGEDVVGYRFIPGPDGISTEVLIIND